MKSNAELPWIEAGYELFAQQGPEGLRIEQLARLVGISKSSFYHHFADLEIFQEKLLTHHLSCTELVVARTGLCKTFDPDFLYLIIELKTYVLFNRQLRIHRDNVAFQLCFERAVSMVEEELTTLWAEMLDLKQNPHIARNILKVTVDLFYHRFTGNNLTYDWLIAFVEEVKTFLRDVIRSSGVASQIR